MDRSVCSCALTCCLQLQGVPFLDELVLLHKPSASLILTDLAFNFDEACMQQLQPGRILTTYLNWAGGHRRCCCTKPFKWLIKDPGGASVWQGVCMHRSKR